MMRHSPFLFCATASVAFAVGCVDHGVTAPQPLLQSPLGLVTSSALPLTFSVLDPVGDQTGPVDVVSMVLNFDNATGQYEIVLTADAAHPFVGDFRININLYNQDLGTTNPDPAFFGDAGNDFSLSVPTTTITLTGTSTSLVAWAAAHRVFTNSLAGTGNPDGVTLFRSTVLGLPFEFLTNEDVIAFQDLARPAIIRASVPVDLPTGFSIRLVTTFETPPIGLALSSGGAFGNRLFVALRGEPGAPDRIQAVTLDGQVTPFALLLAEADPVALEFPPPGSAFGGDLFVSANNRDGGAPGDHGGTVQRVDAQGNVTDFTAIGALSEPRDIAFAAGGGLGTDLFVANHVNPPMDVGRVSPSGSVATFFEAGLTATDLAIGSEDRMYILTDVFSGQGCNCLFVLDPPLNLSGPIATFDGTPGSGVIGSGAFGTDLYLVEGGSIRRVDAAGTVTDFATGLNATNTDGLAFSPDGASLFVLSGLGVYEITFAPTNQAPIANPGGPYTGPEGSAIAFDASGSSDPDGDVLTYAWDFGDGSGATEVSPTHSYADNGAFQVTLTVTDANGMSGAVLTSATIDNVAPSVAPFAGATILRGETYNSTSVFTDPGTDIWTATVDYGDGSGLQPLPLTGMTFGLSHAYEAPGTYVVRATVSDDDGGSGVAQASVVVQSPQEATGALLTSLNDLVVTGVLSLGNANALGAKLRAALTQLAAGNPGAAANQLRAFINQVNGLVSGGRLPSDQGRALVDAAMRIIRAIQLF
jgi:PKD repeat protein